MGQMTVSGFNLRCYKWYCYVCTCVICSVDTKRHIIVNSVSASVAPHGDRYRTKQPLTTRCQCERKLSFAVVNSVYVFYRWQHYLSRFKLYTAR